MTRVAVDLTSLLDRLTGVGVFVRELTGRLAARDDMTLTGYAVTWRGRRRLAAGHAGGDLVGLATGEPHPAALRAVGDLDAFPGRYGQVHVVADGALHGAEPTLDAQRSDSSSSS